MTGLHPVTLGTAGHVDHGKTTLVRALTGHDTDRLKEEKERGLSVALGYAPLELSSGRRISVIDVPGHERFVRTMVAGASGVDCFLMCVAADDGVMPQTCEHLAVLRALDVRRGVAAITKCDVADPCRAIAQTAQLLPDVEVVPVSASTGAGLERLVASLERLAAEVRPRAVAGGTPRLHVDRSFTLRGIGTIVTGTLWSGRIAIGDRLLLLPQNREVRVRSLQVHDTPVTDASAGQRVALNLAGVRHRDVRGGDVLTAAGAELRASRLVNASLTLEPDAGTLARGARVQVHHGTRQAPARVLPLDGGVLEPGESVCCRLALEVPLIPARGDRLVVRRIAPPETIGGGQVTDPRPLCQPAPTPAAPETPTTPDLHDAAQRLSALLREDGERPRADRALAEAASIDAALAPHVWRALERAGEAVRTGANRHFDARSLEALVARVLELCERDGSASAASVRDELQTTRRYAQGVLEHMDAAKLTVRHGDRHFLRRRART